MKPRLFVVAALLWGSVIAALSPHLALAQSPADRERMMIEQQRRVREQEQRDAAKAAAEAQRRSDAERAQETRKRADAQRQRETGEMQGAVDDAAKKIALQLTSPPAAKIVSINAEYVTLVGGHNAGVARGDTVRCSARGAPLVDDAGQDLGYDETPIGTGTVEQVIEKTALVKFAAAQATPKVGDVCRRDRVDLGKVALLPLLYQGERTRLGENIEEHLYQDLTERGVALVERSQLTRIIAEQKLGDSALVDEKNAAHIGALLGADALLLGTLDDLGARILVAARVASARDGLVLASVQLGLPKNDTSLAMLDRTGTPEDEVGQLSAKKAGEVTLDNPATAARNAVARAQNYIDAGQLKEAGAAFAKAVKLKPDLPEVKALGKALRDARARDAPKLLNKADALLEAGLLDEAADAFVDAVALNPDLPDVKVVAGRIRAATQAADRETHAALVRERQRATRQDMKAGEWQRADKNLAVGVALAPDDPGNREMVAEIDQQPLPERVSDAVLNLFRRLR